MSRAAVELDFFGLEKANPNANASKSQFQKFLHRRRSFRDLQGSISKIDPQLIKTVIESGSVNQNQNRSGSSVSIPSTPEGDQISLPPLPVYNPAPKPAASEISGDTAPLTIFYNGVVTVYDIPREKAESILKLAEEKRGKAVESADPKVATDKKQLLETLNNGDLPIFRKKSLQRFLEKRRERLTSTCPYAPPL
jgi:jasmonate ZIM domain-containing protein